MLDVLHSLKLCYMHHLFFKTTFFPLILEICGQNNCLNAYNNIAYWDGLKSSVDCFIIALILSFSEAFALTKSAVYKEI